MVMEAVSIKVAKEDEKARKDAEKAAKRKQLVEQAQENLKNFT